MRSNCFFYAVTRWIRRGGYLIMRRSVAGPFPHFLHADELPADLPATQYVPNQDVPCDIIFEGHVEETVGTVKPPPVTGKLDWALLGFWLSYLLGWVAFFSWIFG